VAVHSHVLDVYGVHLHLATNRRDWATLRRRFDFLPKSPDAIGLTQFAIWHPKRGGPHVPHLVIWIDIANLEPIDLVDTAAHEAAHGAGQILQYLGHDFRGEDGTDEPHAYLVGWLTRWIFQGCAQ
jgi:hypothetical protein